MCDPTGRRMSISGTSEHHSDFSVRCAAIHALCDGRHSREIHKGLKGRPSHSHGGTHVKVDSSADGARGSRDRHFRGASRSGPTSVGLSRPLQPVLDPLYATFPNQHKKRFHSQVVNKVSGGVGTLPPECPRPMRPAKWSCRWSLSTGLVAPEAACGLRPVEQSRAAAKTEAPAELIDGRPLITALPTEVTAVISGSMPWLCDRSRTTHRSVRCRHRLICAEAASRPASAFASSGHNDAKAYDRVVPNCGSEQVQQNLLMMLQRRLSRMGRIGSHSLRGVVHSPR